MGVFLHVWKKDRLSVGRPGERLISIALPDGAPSQARQSRDAAV
jgi:hypothetical protein